MLVEDKDRLVDKKEVYYVIQTPLTERDYYRFGIQKLQQRGFNVWVLDLTKIINPDVTTRAFSEVITDRQYINFYSREAFEDFFKGRNPRDFVAIDIIGLNKYTSFIYKCYERYRIVYAYFCSNSIPRVSYRLNTFIFSKEFLKRAVKGIKNRIINLKFKATPSYILLGGRCDLRRVPKAATKPKLIWIHSFDYDVYLDYHSQKRAPLVQGDYAVFLDEYYPYHPDLLASNVQQNPYDDPKEYYYEINKFLNQLEHKLKIPIVIAAHPRSNYEEMFPEAYSGRKMFKGKTIDLVAGAKCVITHASTSISFAVLSRKPIIFLMPQKLKNRYWGEFILGFAKEFKKDPIDINEVPGINLKEQLFVDEECYNDYRENYIKKLNTPQEYFWDVVIESVLIPQLCQGRRGDSANRNIEEGKVADYVK